MILIFISWFISLHETIRNLKKKTFNIGLCLFPMAFWSILFSFQQLHFQFWCSYIPFCVKMLIVLMSKTSHSPAQERCTEPLLEPASSSRRVFSFCAKIKPSNWCFLATATVSYPRMATEHPQSTPGCSLCPFREQQKWNSTTSSQCCWGWD